MIADRDVRQIDGSCHCGTVRFRVRLTNHPSDREKAAGPRVAGFLRYIRA